MNKTKCVIYCRVSSREQEETGYSLEAQEKLLKNHADKEGYVVGKVYKVTESASKWQIRKTLTEMLAYAEKYKIDAILVEKIDRLTRSLKDAGIVDDWVRGEKEREVHFVKENFVLNQNTRAHESLVWDMKVAIARFYTNNLSEEVKKGQKEKIEQGWLPTKPPLGYKTLGDKGHKIHVIDEEKGVFIKRVFQYYATGNYSLSALRDLLYTEGLRTRNGSKLSKSRLDDILHDPFYIGSMKWNGVIYGNGKHEPLVSKELFDQVQYLITRKKVPHYKRHLFQFTKMIKCGECDGTVSAEIQKGHIYYSCKHGKVCSQKGGLREEVIDNSLLDVFKIFETVTPEEADEIRDRIKADHRIEAEYKGNTLNTLNARYNVLQRQLDILYTDRLTENITEERWKGKQKEINEEQALILDQIDRLKNEETKYFELYINILDLARRAREIYLKRTPEERRMLLTHIFSHLVLKDKKSNYTLKKAVEVYAKRVQEKLDMEKSLEPMQKTAETVVSSGDLHIPGSTFSSGPSEGQNEFRTSRKRSVKVRHGVTHSTSRSLLRG